MDGDASAKRGRDDSGEPAESPRAKRLHAAADRILLDILDDVDPAGTAAAGDLATVMRSFEEEIAALSPCPQLQQQEDAAAQISGSDLGYLLEASDDDLGLPPTLPPPADGGEAAAEGGGSSVGDGGGEGLEGLGQLWAFDDEAAAPGCYDALGFGGFAQDDGFVALDGDLFGYPDVASSGPPEFWRSESLPAV